MLLDTPIQAFRNPKVVFKNSRAKKFKFLTWTKINTNFQKYISFTEHIKVHVNVSLKSTGICEVKKVRRHWFVYELCYIIMLYVCVCTLLTLRWRQQTSYALCFTFINLRVALTTVQLLLSMFDIMLFTPSVYIALNNNELYMLRV